MESELSLGNTRAPETPEWKLAWDAEVAEAHSNSVDRQDGRPSRCVMEDYITEYRDRLDPEFVAFVEAQLSVPESEYFKAE